MRAVKIILYSLLALYFLITGYGFYIVHFKNENLQLSETKEISKTHNYKWTYIPFDESGVSGFAWGAGCLDGSKLSAIAKTHVGRREYMGKEAGGFRVQCVELIEEYEDG